MKFGQKRGFTLIELLIVIGVVATLATITLLVLNPAEMLKQGRDAKRISEIASINDALNLAVAQNPNISLGTAKRLYISLSDETEACDSHLANLPLLPAATGWEYRCATAENLRKTDGSGWLPVNFAGLPSSPFSNLPVDPVNNAQEGRYYSYVMGGSWELGATMESSKYGEGGQRDVVSSDSGTRGDMYERGTNLSLLPFDEIKIPESCFANDSTPSSHQLEIYSKWIIPTTQTVHAIGLYLYNASFNLLDNGSSVLLGMYTGSGNNFTLVATTTISGAGGESWLYGELSNSVEVTPGQANLFGILRKTGSYEIVEDNDSCSDYLPIGGSNIQGVSGGLDSSFVFSSNYSGHIGGFGIVYVPD